MIFVFQDQKQHTQTISRDMLPTLSYTYIITFQGKKVNKNSASQKKCGGKSNIISFRFFTPTIDKEPFILYLG